MKAIDRDLARQIEEAITHAEHEIDRAMGNCDEAGLPRKCSKLLDECIGRLEEVKWIVIARSEAR